MPVNRLVSFCHESITKNGKCADCLLECLNSCNICLQEIHFGNLRTYDCQNMIHCYTCSYIYKYASEIGHLFNLLQYNSFTHFNILSLGCGPAPDLFAINQFLIQQDRELPITYLGVDNNHLWDSTQGTIEEIFPDYSIDFDLHDVFDFLDSLNNLPTIEYNVVVLQYILNELNSHSPERIQEFIDKLVDFIVNRLPDNSTIILNDINHYDVRNIFSRIFVAANIHNLVSYSAYRFLNPPTHTYGGTLHVSDTILFNVPVEISRVHDVKSPCSSAQVVIYKTRNR